MSDLQKVEEVVVVVEEVVEIRDPNELTEEQLNEEYARSINSVNPYVLALEQLLLAPYFSLSEIVLPLPDTRPRLYPVSTIYSVPTAKMPRLICTRRCTFPWTARLPRKTATRRALSIPTPV